MIKKWGYNMDSLQDFQTKVVDAISEMETIADQYWKADVVSSADAQTGCQQLFDLAAQFG